MTTNKEAIRHLFGVERDLTRNLPSMPGIFPDYAAPIIRRAETNGAIQLGSASWAMPSSPKAIFDAASKSADKLRLKNKPVDFDEPLRMEPDKGIQW